MPDVTERLDQEGVQTCSSSPSSSSTTRSQPTGPWAPDNIKAAGYSDVLR